MFLLFAFNAQALPTPIGTFNHGSLDGAVSIFKAFKKDRDKFISVSPEEHQYGTESMRLALFKIADWSLQLKNMPLRVGDIAKKTGGPLARHTTHQIGLDADIGYLLNKVNGSGHRSNAFHNKFTEKLENKGQLSKNLDLNANIKLFEKILKELPANKIYVGCEIYKALEKKLEPGSDLLAKIYAQEGHEDHFHLRLYCPPDQPTCSEKWWRDPNKKPSKQKERLYLNGKWNGCDWYG